MKLDSRKKSKRDRMILSKSFETKEMREIGRMKVRVEKLFCPMDGNNGRGLPDGGKECKNHERLKMCRRKFMPKQGR